MDNRLQVMPLLLDHELEYIQNNGEVRFFGREYNVWLKRGCVEIVMPRFKNEIDFLIGGDEIFDSMKMINEKTIYKHRYVIRL